MVGRKFSFVAVRLTRNPYEKRLKGGGVMVCEVHVFPLKVTRQSKQWPEKEERDVKWLSIKQAAETVQEPMLSEIIRRLGHKPHP